MQNEDVLNLLAARKGHFLFESGHHGDLWLDLELLCLRPKRIQSLATELARRLSPLDIDIICGPLVEGAFVGLMVASEFDTEFVYAERFSRPTADGLFPAGYRVPDSLRSRIRQKRVAIVNDVINAGSAMRGTFSDLQDCGATVVAISALLVLGSAASEYASAKKVELYSIAALPNHLWEPETCPLCSTGVPLEDLGGFRTLLGAA